LSVELASRHAEQYELSSPRPPQCCALWATAACSPSAAKSSGAPSYGDRGFESVSLQRRESSANLTFGGSSRGQFGSEPQVPLERFRADRLRFRGSIPRFIWSFYANISKYDPMRDRAHMSDYMQSDVSDAPEFGINFRDGEIQ